jgi:hypothetical protein
MTGCFHRALRRQLEGVHMRPHASRFLIPMRRFPIPALILGVVAFLDRPAVLVAFVLPAVGTTIAATTPPEEDPDADRGGCDADSDSYSDADS